MSARVHSGSIRAVSHPESARARERRRNRPTPWCSFVRRRRALPQLVPIIEPLLDLAFEAALARPVEIATRDAVRKIVLAGKTFFGRVIVDIAMPIAELA